MKPARRVMGMSFSDEIEVENVVSVTLVNYVNKETKLVENSEHFE